MAAEQTCEACGCPIPMSETAFLHGEKVLCRDCHDQAAPVCPYCRKDLPAKPETVSPCPFCNEMIELRPRQRLYDTALLTREQVAEVERILDIIKPAASFGAVERDYLATRERLSSPRVTPSDFDVVKTIFYDLSKRISEPRRLAELHRAEAEYFYANGKDPYYVLRKALQQELIDLKARGVTEVRLGGVPRDCSECRKLGGRRLPIDQALAELPAPAKHCPLKTGGQELRIGGQTLQVSKGTRAMCELHYEPAAVAGAEA